MKKCFALFMVAILAISFVGCNKGGLSDLNTVKGTITLDGEPLALTAGYTYDETTGEFATVAGAITVPAATFSQDETTGEWITTPGAAVLTISGTVS